MTPLLRITPMREERGFCVEVADPTAIIPDDVTLPRVFASKVHAVQFRDAVEARSWNAHDPDPDCPCKACREEI